MADEYQSIVAISEGPYLEQNLKSVNISDNDFANKPKQNQTAHVQCAKPALHLLITPDNDVCNTHHPHTRTAQINT